MSAYERVNIDGNWGMLTNKIPMKGAGSQSSK